MRELVNIIKWVHRPSNKYYIVWRFASYSNINI